ncbi:MAG: glycosyltransferase family 4 protein [Magnetospiraceae bacterium]
MPMKILYHHRSRSKDGQYVHIMELVTALRAQGHEVIMVGPQMVDPDVDGTQQSLLGSLKKRLPGAVYELLELGYSVPAFWRLRKAYQAHQPDVLYERYNLYQVAGVFLKRLYRLPMLLEINAPLVEERSQYGGLALPWLARWSERAAWRGADRALPVTQVLADHVTRAGVDPARVAVVPNGIDPDHFATAPDTETAKAALGLSGKFVLGFTGYVRDWHGLERVVDFIAETESDKDFHLLLVGDGPARAAIETRAVQRGVGGAVTVTGIVGREDVAAHVAAFDIALQPAVTAYASPLKMFEYMVLEKPIIAPSSPNIREILVDMEDAVLFDPSRPEEFREKLQFLCFHDDIRAKVARGAAQTVQRRGFYWSENAKRVAAMFDALRRSTTG